MNLKKQFLLISLILLTWACDSGNSIHYQPALLQLEDSLEQTPQKTLHALWLMDTTAFRPEDRQLYHYIAYKGAMLLPDEKNPKPEELKASIGYFREKGDSARLYQLYYYLGQVYTGHFAWLRASNSFAEARKYAGQNPRRVFQAKLGEAYVYRFKMMYKEEETCLEQALQIARSLSDRNLKDLPDTNCRSFICIRRGMQMRTVYSRRWSAVRKGSSRRCSVPRASASWEGAFSGWDNPIRRWSAWEKPCVWITVGGNVRSAACLEASRSSVCIASTRRKRP